jgi:hypothetical protein
MRARISDFTALARAVRFGIGLPFGFLRWMRLVKPWAARCASFFSER